MNKQYDNLIESNKTHNDNLDKHFVLANSECSYCKCKIKLITCFVFSCIVCIVFLEINSFYKKYSCYNAGIKFFNEKNYIKALNEFALAGNYKDAKEKLKEASKHIFGKLDECLNQFGIEMVICPAGSYIETKKDKNSKKNQNKLIISRPFAISKYEITRAQYFSIIEPSTNTQILNPTLENLSKPVTVNWNDAKKFCEKLNKMFADKLSANYMFDLPTDVQWEYACRAGKNSRFYNGPTEGDYYDMGWMLNNSSGIIHIVGQKMPNDWGIYDMYGNVWEWCKNSCEKCESKASKEMKSIEYMKDSCRILRGGSFHNNFFPKQTTSYAFPDTNEIGDIGFRPIFVSISQ